MGKLARRAQPRKAILIRLGMDKTDADRMGELEILKLWKAYLVSCIKRGSTIQQLANMTGMSYATIRNDLGERLV